MNEENQFLGQENISTLMRKYAIPCIISLLVGALYNIVDQIFMGKALESTALSMIREIVFGVGFALILPLFFGLDGVLYSMPVSDFLTFLVAVILIVQTNKELGDNREKEAEDLIAEAGLSAENVH